MSLAARIAQVHAGEITDAEFFRTTDREWRSLAGYLLRRWPAPPGVEVEDVAQELRMQAILALRRYDPAREVKGGPGRFVQWNAVMQTRKGLDRQAGRRAGCPAMIPTPISWFEDLPEPAIDADQHGRAEIEEAGRLKGLDQEIGTARARCVQAFVLHEGDIDRAAATIQGDWQLSLVLGIGCEADAKKVIRESAAAAARRAT